MAKIDLTAEVLRHNDEDIIEFLTQQLKGVVQVYSSHTESAQLEVCATQIGLVFNVLKAMDKRNKDKTGQASTVVL